VQSEFDFSLQLFILAVHGYLLLETWNRISAFMDAEDKKEKTSADKIK